MSRKFYRRLEKDSGIRKRILYAQNYLKSASLVKTLVAQSSIGREDTVYEIGPGNGIITAELAKIARKVIAIELDENLVKRLTNQFTGSTNIEIVQGNFIDFQIPDEKYKVFANLPFNITAETVRKLLYARNPPIDAYLILQKEAAGKFSGSPRESEFSVLAKPWFSLQELWSFKKSDFVPAPAVDVVLLHIRRREISLIKNEEAKQYTRFVKFGFGAWKKDLKTAFKSVFTYEQWKRLSRDNRFNIDAKPTDLIFDQWLAIYQFFSVGVSAAKKSNIA
ncbi:MAG: 23S ribosomal RNA methyltransferase Erm [Anaerolineales bacterium]|nr:23S ribosomal RNA methyltransferase Erm [Anaerolineales bacterium]